jgi:pimeloyl-ACP methyl ester carboxylesterase
MSEDAVASCRAWAEHSVAVPGGRIDYRTEGCGPPLVLIGGGPSNADTLGALARPPRNEQRLQSRKMSSHPLCRQPARVLHQAITSP